MGKHLGGRCLAGLRMEEETAKSMEVTGMYQQAFPAQKK